MADENDKPGMGVTGVGAGIVTAGVVAGAGGLLANKKRRGLLTDEAVKAIDGKTATEFAPSMTKDAQSIAEKATEAARAAGKSAEEIATAGTAAGTAAESAAKRAFTIAKDVGEAKWYARPVKAVMAMSTKGKIIVGLGALVVGGAVALGIKGHRQNKWQERIDAERAAQVETPQQAR